jgi:hypothetical protein
MVPCTRQGLSPLPQRRKKENTNGRTRGRYEGLIQEERRQELEVVYGHLDRLLGCVPRSRFSGLHASNRRVGFPTREACFRSPTRVSLNLCILRIILLVFGHFCFCPVLVGWW